MKGFKKNKPQVSEGFQKDTLLTRAQKRMIFYVLMMALPVIQFCIFYVYVNINSIRLAFVQFDLREGGVGYDTIFVGFQNFKVAWEFFTSNGQMIVNSLYLYAGNLIIVMGLALVFSYYIAKKYMLAGFFRAVLYLPHIISSVVLVILYKYMVTDVYIEIVKKLTGQEVVGLLEQDFNTRFFTIIFYNLWVGFGSNVLIFTGTMSGIDGSIIESAQLDGVNIIQEFIHIYIPMIFPTFTTFVVTGMTAIFTADMHLYTFYGGGGADGIDVFGYYMYRTTVNGSMYEKSAKGLSYSGLSALGLIMTFILVPITLTVRKLMETYGPRTD